MGTFYTECTIENHVNRKKTTHIPKILVDTGSCVRLCCVRRKRWPFVTFKKVGFRSSTQPTRLKCLLIFSSISLFPLCLHPWCRCVFNKPIAQLIQLWRTEPNLDKPEPNRDWGKILDLRFQIYDFLNRSTDPSTGSGCSSVHGELVEPSRRSLNS